MLVLTVKAGDVVEVRHGVEVLKLRFLEDHMFTRSRQSFHFMSPTPTTFGAALRARRLEKGVSLRKFAEKVGVSPTYLSLVETEQAPYQPTVDRIKRMAEILGANADEWIQLAGRVSDELEKMTEKSPQMMPALLRIARSMSAEELAQLADRAERKSQEKGKK